MASTNKTAEIQTFSPTMEEFVNFPKYVEYMESKGAHLAGIARIIPPAEWRPRRKGYDTSDVLNFKIQSPIDQKVFGKQGVFTQFNVSKWKSMEVRKFRDLAENKKYKAPVEDYEELERKYWKNLTLNSNSPIYGADTPGSFYDQDQNVWNINNLGTILSEGISGDCRIEGVNTAYLYFGMWRSTFCWHTEDMDLYSINYLHHGEPKFWYSIPTEQSDRFERLAQSFYSDSAKQCKAFLRHKMCLISPNVLKTHSIQVNKVVQSQNQFIITFPKGYHAGFNLGYNIAESTNFASVRWIDFGKNASLCLCKSDTVRINMQCFVERYQPEQYEEWLLSQQDQGGDGEDDVDAEAVVPTSSVTMKRRHPIVNIKRKKLTSATFSEEHVKSVIDQVSTSSSGNTSVNEVKKQEPNVDFAEDPYEFGVWAKPVERLWQFKIYNLNAEMEYNRSQALIEPHCCVCQCFVPKSITYKTNEVPLTSRRILTNLSFTRDTTDHISGGNTEEDQMSGDADRLLTCKHCAVTVHAKCYGIKVSNIKSASDWECERCRRSHSTAECSLCCLRGGALLPTTTRHSEWAHVFCSLFCANTKFNYSNTTTTPSIELLLPHEDVLAVQAACTYCKSNCGKPTTCGYKHSLCKNVFHPTCGYHAGASFEISDWPTMVQAFCSRHNGASGSEDTTSFDVGDSVFVKKDNKFVRGKITGSQIETLCIVDFDDGSFSNNVYIDDLVECNCIGGCKGAHASGAKVKVYWVSDRKYYSAIFRKAYRVRTFNVHLENGDFDKCTHDEMTKSEDDSQFESDFAPLVVRKKAKFTKAEKKFY